MLNNKTILLPSILLISILPLYSSDIQIIPQKVYALEESEIIKEDYLETCKSISYTKWETKQKKEALERLEKQKKQNEVYLKSEEKKELKEKAIREKRKKEEEKKQRAKELAQKRKREKEIKEQKKINKLLRQWEKEENDAKRIEENPNAEYVSSEADNPNYTSNEYLTYKSFPVSGGLEFKSYMDWRKITSTSSMQYKLQHSVAYTGDYGIRMINGRYCVAVGSRFTVKHGTPLDIVLENGNVLKCVLADTKANVDTDSTNTFHKGDGSVVEFVVDSEMLPSSVLQKGSFHVLDEFAGRVIEVRVYES